jgi:hypothetical protein
MGRQCTIFNTGTLQGSFMEMPFRRCISPSCGRPFQLNQFQFSAGVTLPWQRGEMMCPHCGAVMAGDPDSVFLTHAMSPDQETEFNRETRDQIKATSHSRVSATQSGGRVTQV